MPTLPRVLCVQRQTDRMGKSGRAGAAGIIYSHHTERLVATRSAQPRRLVRLVRKVLRQVGIAIVENVLARSAHVVVPPEAARKAVRRPVGVR